jgi:site-specific DNA-methyltransferase (adenine-specific)
MFVLSKGKPNTFNPLKQPCVTAGAKYNYATRSSGSTKEKGGAIRARDEEKVTNSEKYRGNIWSYAVGKHKGSKDDIWAHPATFPEKLAEDHILSWSNEGDTVFDPFMGSGTTNKMAYMHGRHSIGTEKVEKYYEIATERMETVNKNVMPIHLFGEI